MMAMQWGVLHGDLSPNNLIIYKGKGFFIDFDHAKFIKLNNRAMDSHGMVSLKLIYFVPSFLISMFKGNNTIYILVPSQSDGMCSNSSFSPPHGL
jgi:hypothetical protein